jgi:hypothetical protein
MICSLGGVLLLVSHQSSWPGEKLPRNLLFLEHLTTPMLYLIPSSFAPFLATLFTCTMESKKEAVTWQEEEFHWGNLVPYPIIVSAADRFI